MVGASAAADAVARARQMPGLRVGLHLVLIEGGPVLPAAELRGLVRDDGRFDDNQLRAGKIASIVGEMVLSPEMMKRRLREGIEFFQFLRERQMAS